MTKAERRKRVLDRVVYDNAAKFLDGWPVRALHPEPADYFEERAGIRQFDGEQTKAEAEAGALEDVERWALLVLEEGLPA